MEDHEYLSAVIMEALSDIEKMINKSIRDLEDEIKLGKINMDVSKNRKGIKALQDLKNKARERAKAIIEEG